MNRHLFQAKLQSAVLAFGLAGLAAAPAFAQSAQLQPPAKRISDEAINADQRTYEAMQARIKGLNDGGRSVRDYFLSKAQCWLDVSFHEYTRNDRSAFPQEALAEAEKLVVGMELGRSPLPTDTPLVNGAERLRSDLWALAAALRGHSGWSCAQQKAACAEVELVHAGNEHKQQQWRHAKPYVQIAEDLLIEAQALAASCVPAPAPATPELKALPPPSTPPAQPAVPLPPPVPTPAAPERTVQLSAEVVFNFDRYEINQARPYSRVRLEQLVQRILRERLVVESITLTGHADRLNSTGKGDYNQRLSERRVATVKAELERLGLNAAALSTTALGDTQQIEGCQQRFTQQVDLQECLLPNRRVDLVIRARQP